MRTKMAVFEARHPTRKTKVVQLEVMDSFEVTGNMGFLFDELARILPCLGEARRNLKSDTHVDMYLSWYIQAQCMAIANRMYAEFYSTRCESAMILNALRGVNC